MGCGSSTPTLPLDPMSAIRDTIQDVMKGDGAPELLDSVLNRGNVDLAIPDTSIGEATPLLLATKYGNLPALKVVLQLNPNMSATDDLGNTALHLAVKGGNSEVVDHLIQAGSDVNLGNSEGDPPLRTAILYNTDTSILELLLKAAAKTDYSSPESPLYTAATKPNLPAVEVLLQNKADPTGVMVPLTTGESVDLLTWATKEGNATIVGLLSLTGDGDNRVYPALPAEEGGDNRDPRNTDGKADDGSTEVADGAPNTVVTDMALLQKAGDQEREGGDGEEQPYNGGEEGHPSGDVKTAEEPSDVGNADGDTGEKTADGDGGAGTATAKDTGEEAAVEANGGGETTGDAAPSAPEK